MKKILDNEQQFLLQLIRSCEYYPFSEKQSIECINKILPETFLDVLKDTPHLYDKRSIRKNMVSNNEMAQSPFRFD